MIVIKFRISYSSQCEKISQKQYKELSDQGSFDFVCTPCRELKNAQQTQPPRESISAPTRPLYPTSQPTPSPHAARAADSRTSSKQTGTQRQSSTNPALQRVQYMPQASMFSIFGRNTTFNSSLHQHTLPTSSAPISHSVHASATLPTSSAPISHSVHASAVVSSASSSKFPSFLPTFRPSQLTFSRNSGFNAQAAALTYSQPTLPAHMYYQLQAEPSKQLSTSVSAQSLNERPLEPVAKALQSLPRANEIKPAAPPVGYSFALPHKPKPSPVFTSSAQTSASKHIWFAATHVQPQQPNATMNENHASPPKERPYLQHFNSTSILRQPIPQTQGTAVGHTATAVRLDEPADVAEFLSPRPSLPQPSFDFNSIGQLQPQSTSLAQQILNRNAHHRLPCEVPMSPQQSYEPRRELLPPFMQPAYPDLLRLTPPRGPAGIPVIDSSRMSTWRPVTSANSVGFVLPPPTHFDIAEFTKSINSATMPGPASVPATSAELPDMNQSSNGFDHRGKDDDVVLLELQTATQADFEPAPTFQYSEQLVATSHEQCLSHPHNTASVSQELFASPPQRSVSHTWQQSVDMLATVSQFAPTAASPTDVQLLANDVTGPRHISTTVAEQNMGILSLDDDDVTSLHSDTSEPEQELSQSKQTAIHGSDAPLSAEEQRFMYAMYAYRPDHNADCRKCALCQIHGDGAPNEVSKSCCQQLKEMNELSAWSAAERRCGYVGARQLCCLVLGLWRPTMFGLAPIMFNAR